MGPIIPGKKLRKYFGFYCYVANSYNYISLNDIHLISQFLEKGFWTPLHRVLSSRFLMAAMKTVAGLRVKLGGLF